MPIAQRREAPWRRQPHRAPPGGAIVPGIVVTAADTAGNIVASVTTDGNGRYRLAGLGDAEHILVASGDPVGSAGLEVRSGETASLTIRLGGAHARPERADPAWRRRAAWSGPALCTTRRSEPSG